MQTSTERTTGSEGEKKEKKKQQACLLYRNYTIEHLNTKTETLILPM